uniref:Transmembrane protein 97 n=2 Tax=Anas TaxID=8835 RepID=A0A8B9UCH7_9AVES
MENCLLLQCSLGVSRALCGLHQWERGESCRGSSPPALRADGPGPAVPAATAPPSEPRAALRGRLQLPQPPAAGGGLHPSARGARLLPPPPRPPPGLRSPLPPRAVPGRVREAMAGWWRCAERLFALYFVSHVPITLLIDLQPLLPAAGLYPRSLTELLEWYAVTFRDPMMMQPPEWFKAFMYCEAFLQMPFFPIAAYAFIKGGCKWIRTPAIIYSTHVATSLVAILAHILFHDFSKSEHLGPRTQQERLILLSIYIPYLLIPLLILFTMLYSPQYNQVEKRKRK